jgi:hypothetical protein
MRFKGWHLRQAAHAAPSGGQMTRAVPPATSPDTGTQPEYGTIPRGCVTMPARANAGTSLRSHIRFHVGSHLHGDNSGGEFDSHLTNEVHVTTPQICIR